MKASNLNGKATEFLHKHGLTAFKKPDNEEISFTSPAKKVVKLLTFDYLQQFYEVLAHDFVRGKQYSWCETFSSSGISGVAIDIDIGMVSDTPETLKFAVTISEIFWRITQICFGNDVWILACLAWPPWAYTVEPKTKKKFVKPSTYTLFGQECFLRDDELLSDQELDRARTAVDEADISEPSSDHVKAAIEDGDESTWTWNEPPVPEPKALKLGLHLYAFCGIDKPSNKVRKLFVTRNDLSLLNAILVDQLTLCLEPKDKPWHEAIDTKISSLRIPGAGKVVPCPHCDPKKIRSSGQRNSDVLRNDCYCFGYKTLVQGRQYVPFGLINDTHDLDFSTGPAQLCKQPQMPVVFEIARLRHYPDHDPAPRRMTVPQGWAEKAADVQYCKVYDTRNEVVEHQRAPKSIVPASGPAEHRILVQLDRNTYPEIFLAFDKWFSTNTYHNSWKDLTVTKIQIKGLNKPKNWEAFVYTKKPSSKSGVYCFRDKGIHTNCPLYFVVFAKQLEQHYEFLQSCNGCQSKPTKKCRNTDNSIFQSFLVVLARLQTQSPDLFSPAQQEQKDNGEALPVQEKPCFVISKRPANPMPGEESQPAKKKQKRGGKLPNDMSKIWGSQAF